MTKEKEIGYKVGDVYFHNLPRFEKLWNSTDVATKDKIVNMVGELVKNLTLPQVSRCDGCEREALLKLKQFVENQEDLPDDINQIVNDNFWDLI